jgi:hypothetical protein
MHAVLRVEANEPVAKPVAGALRDALPGTLRDTLRDTGHVVHVVPG